MKFWPLGSALLLGALVACGTRAQAQRPAARRSNELTLAGLRPGRDNLAAALKRYKAKLADPTSANSKEWHDACTGHSLALELDAQMVIQGITVSALAPRDGKCDDRRLDSLGMAEWITGLGLHLNDSQDRVIALYGEANSTGPSVKGDKELEFLYYAFDWAGSDVPQVLEVYCARDTGKVVEITLAYPSL
jgi:hypothetical protein